MSFYKKCVIVILILFPIAQYGQSTSEETVIETALKYAKNIKTRSDIYIDMEIKYRAEKNLQMADDLIKKRKKMKADMVELTAGFFLGEAYLQNKMKKELTNFYLASSTQVPLEGFIDKFKVTVIWEDYEDKNSFLLKKDGISLLILTRKEGVYQNVKKATMLLKKAFDNYLDGQEIGVDAYGLYYCYEKTFSNGSKSIELEYDSKITDDSTTWLWNKKRGL